MRENSESRRPMARYASGAMAIIALIMTGTACSGPSANWVGTWKGAYSSVATQGELDPTMIRGLSAVVLEIRADASFKLQWFSIPHEGTVEFGKDTAILHVTRIMDRPVSEDSIWNRETIKLQMKSNSLAIMTSNGAPDPTPVELRRQADKTSDN
ncbi:MAG: hypothetical protein JST40_06630 [Armatimonadetes bacterium]|nr:hypothetical protein [Armatimonadota bacterium]